MTIFLNLFWEKKWIFFLAILKFLMAALNAQKNFMQQTIIFFFLSLLDKKLYCFYVKKIAKIDHAICDCNWLCLDMQIN